MSAATEPLRCPDCGSRTCERDSECPAYMAAADAAPSADACERAGIDWQRVEGTGIGGLITWEDLARHMLDKYAPERAVAPVLALVPGVADPDGYTSTPTRVRVYQEETGDADVWHLDGADNARGYTEHVWRFGSHADAVAAIPDFVQESTAQGIRFDWRGRPITAAERTERGGK